MTMQKKTKVTLTVLGAVVLVLAIAATVWFTRPVSVDYGESDIYTSQEIASAVDCVKADFVSFSLQGCRLFSLSYAGDQKSLRETETQFRYGRRPYDEFIVIDSAFLSPLFGGGGWNNGSMYYWSWILGRKAGGSWVVVDKGYA